MTSTSGEEAARAPNETPAEERKSKKAKKTKAAGVFTPTGALPARVAYPLAFLSGFLYFLGFPGIDIWPLSFVALVPLIVALRGQTPRRAAGLGWLAGFTMTMTGFYWLLEMLQVFSGFPVVLCVLFMAILCAYQGGRIALAGWLYGRAEARGWPAAPVFALAFAVSELVYPLLFPWYYGASVHNAPVMMQVADLGGPILVGLALVAPNLALAEVVLARLRKEKIDRRVIAVGLAVPLLAAIYGFVRIRGVDGAMAAAEKVRIGIVQGNMPLFDRNRALPLHVKMTQDIEREKDVDLVVWSEAAVPRSFSEARYEDEVYRTISQKLGVPTIVGTVLRRPAGPGGRAAFFNTALMAGDDGKILGRYDKQYLLAFGEYLPFGETFPILYKWSPNSGQFTPGKSFEPLTWRDHRISTLICYEDILPAFVRQLVSHGDPDLLVNLTNDAWFGDSTEPWIHFALAKMRAVEHRRFLVRATNSGVSGIVDAAGRVVAHGGTFREEAIVGEARFMRQKTLYGMIGDAPWFIATLVIGAMAIRSKPKKVAPNKPETKAAEEVPAS
ncbi:apolipoprotein N-acyltransferase [Polyangium aurulentum]|uniref:apolipoprotein N-acyltransferase n=1 Tax=Polyangium aurulentum TaxID=2567896 RepID=UPI0010ADD9EA|nr:apolipoprotein N-acyltransferase [Polyangium aurulentum]UQA56250.1 apolipoprotein N-acyltransferase [Polyangium aurulentum]